MCIFKQIKIFIYIYIYIYIHMYIYINICMYIIHVQLFSLSANDHQDVVVDWKWSLDFVSRRLEKRRHGELVCEMVGSGGARWASNEPERPWIGNGSEASCDCDTFGGRQSKCHFRSTRASLVNGPGGRLLCGD